MKKIQAILLAAVLLLGCFSAALAEKYPEGTLYKGMTGHTAEVKDLQQWLKDLGYLNDKVDGKFGKNTQSALKAFRRTMAFLLMALPGPRFCMIWKTNGVSCFLMNPVRNIPRTAR